MNVITAITLGLMIWPLLATPTKAECTSIGTVKRQVSQIFPLARMNEIGGSEMAAFLFGLNHIEPSTAVIADYGLILQNPDKDKVAVVLFTYGCYTAVMFITKEDLARLMGTL